MRHVNWRPLLDRTARIASDFLDGLPERPVSPRKDAAAMLEALDHPLPETPTAPEAVVDELVRVVEPGITAMPSGRFFGWVIGGGLPSAIAADWLTSVWDQNTGSGEGTPAAAVIEHVAIGWVAKLLELPVGSGALVTGAQMASFVGLAAARTEVLRMAGWDVEADGLTGAPPIEVVVGAERHGTIDRALRMLGIGTKQVRIVDADREGRMRADRLDAAGHGPLIVCAQAGNVNGGGFDPLRAIGERVADARKRRHLLHVVARSDCGRGSRLPARHRRQAETGSGRSVKWLAPTTAETLVQRRRALEGLPRSRHLPTGRWSRAESIRSHTGAFASCARVRVVGRVARAGTLRRGRPRGALLCTCHVVRTRTDGHRRSRSDERGDAEPGRRPISRSRGHR
jgi:hypothetical protein